MMIESERANLRGYCGFDCGNPFLRLYWMADAMPLIVSSPGRVWKMKVGISRHEGMDAKKSDGFKCDKNNAYYQNCVWVGPLSFIISNIVHSTMNICDIHQRIQFSNFNIYKLLSFCNPFLIRKHPVFLLSNLCWRMVRGTKRTRKLQGPPWDWRTHKEVCQCRKYDHKKGGEQIFSPRGQLTKKRADVEKETLSFIKGTTHIA